MAESKGTAFGPRSGSPRKVLPPAHAKPEPSPPRRLAGTPFSSVSPRPERSVVPPLASVTFPTASSLTWAAAGRTATIPDSRARAATNDGLTLDSPEVLVKERGDDRARG